MQDLKSNHQRVWLQVSDASGAALNLNWAKKYLLKVACLPAGEIGVDEGTLCEQLLQNAQLTKAKSEAAQAKSAKRSSQMSSIVSTRWGLLRQALRSNSAQADSKVSVRRHEGYSLLACSTAQVHTSTAPHRPSYQVELYLWPNTETTPPSSGVEPPPQCFPLLAPVTPQVTLEDLVSHRRTGAAAASSSGSNAPRGVDNTGNVCVWPAEQVLTHLLLTAGSAGGVAEGGLLLELGGGRSCMAAVAAAFCAGFASWRVAGTDGNAKAASAAAGSLALFWPAGQGGGDTEEQAAMQRAVLALQQSQAAAGPPTLSFAARGLAFGALQWDTTHAAQQVPVLLTGSVPQTGETQSSTLDVRRDADLIVAADCLFFESYAEHLLSTCFGALRLEAAPVEPTGGTYGSSTLASALLAPAPGCTRGIPQVWLLAPERGGSRSRFVARAQVWQAPGTDEPAWAVLQFEQYDEAVQHAHAGAAKGATGGYEADLHHPLLVVLCAPHWEEELRSRAEACSGVVMVV